MGASLYNSWGAALWHRVDISPEGCWLWKGPKSSSGYGRVNRYIDGKARWRQAHRIAWAEMHDDPGDLHVCHRCDIRLCVRPDHLFLGTAADNMADMRRKGRGARGERHGRARLTLDQVHEIRRIGQSKTKREIAAAFGVSREHVRDILARKKWAHA